VSVLNQSDRPDWVREHRVAALRSAKMLRSLLHYELMEPIAEGGMGAVYRARDTKLNRDVAIKVIREDLAASVNRERFKREIQIAIHLSHPSIVPVYDAGEVDGNLFFVMPLVLGSAGRSAETLSARLSRVERLEVDEATRITADIASGLAHAHAKGIVHRDIKPGNILLAGDRAMVADFGLAVALEAEGDGRITKSGVVPGTPLYMSPSRPLASAPSTRAATSTASHASHTRC